MAINELLLELLACPSCKAPVELVKSHWLVCAECERKYPIVNDIPVMLVEEGEKYISTPIEALPDPNHHDV